MTFTRQLKIIGSYKWVFRKLVNLSRIFLLEKLIVAFIEHEISFTEPYEFTQNPLILFLFSISLNFILLSTLNSQVANSIQVYRLNSIRIPHLFYACCMQQPCVPPWLDRRKQVWGSRDIKTTNTSVTVAASQSHTRTCRIRVRSFTTEKIASSLLLAIYSFLNNFV
jgi:hypothetical protein